MDGLLIDSETIYQAGLVNAAVAMGFELPPSVHSRMIGLAGPDSEALLRNHFGEAFPLDAYHTAVTDEIERLLEAGVCLKTGVNELLDHLEAAGIPRAVATSSSQYWADRHLGQTGVLHRFQAVLTRDDVERAKPHPDLFLKAAEVLGVDPAHCLALEDSHNGIRAAHAAGMMAVMVPDLLQPTDEMHDKCALIVADLHLVRALIEAQA